MKYTILLSLLISILIFSACRPEPLEISIPILDPQIVVFSQVIPDEIMTVALTKTIGALDFSEEEGDTVNQDILNSLLETDAMVSVSYRDVVDTLFEVGNGLYASIATPQFVNETYTLKINTKDGETLTAVNKMLPLVKFDAITPEIERTADDTLVKVNFKITDLPENNWYMLNFYTNGSGQQTGIDINSFFQTGSNLLKKTELLSDLVFNGNVFEGTVELPEVAATDSLVVSLSNISETYFNYLEIRENSSNFFTELTKEPVTLPTNVEGGLGFFNTHFPDINYFDLNDF